MPADHSGAAPHWPRDPVAAAAYRRSVGLSPPGADRQEAKRAPYPATERAQSKGEELLWSQMGMLLPEDMPERQYKFAERLGRNFAFDFCWKHRSFAVEVEGHVHRIKARWRAGLERQNLEQALKWTVFRFAPAEVVSGKAVDVIARWLRGDQAGAIEAMQREG